MTKGRSQPWNTAIVSAQVTPEMKVHVHNCGGDVLRYRVSKIHKDALHIFVFLWIFMLSHTVVVVFFDVCFELFSIWS